MKSQLAKLNDEEKALYEQLKETESRISQLRAQTKGCELALREASARLEKAADVWRKKPEIQCLSRPLKSKTSARRRRARPLKHDIQSYWDQTKQFESNLKRIAEKLGGRSISAEEWEKAAVLKEQAEEAFSSALEERGQQEKRWLSSVKTINDLKSLKHP